MLKYYVFAKTGGYMMKKGLCSVLLTAAFLLLCSPGFGRSWSDLDEGERKYYGSEKEEKYSINAFFVEKEEWADHYSLMLFGLYKYTDYPKYRSRRVLPFYYGLSSKIDNRKMTVLPLFLSWFETDRDEETSHILFPLYYSSLRERAADRSILVLLRWGREHNSFKSESYQTLIPLFYHSNETYTKSGREESYFISPLLNWIDDNKPGQESDTVWWFPIIPLTFHSTDKYGGHRNILWLMDYTWDTVKGEDYMQRFWIFPLFMWKRGTDGYTSVLFPVYMNSRYSNGDYYRNLLPLYASWRDTYSKNVEETTMTPFFGYSKETEKKSGSEIASTLWFPILPLFYRSSSRDEGSHTNLLWLIDWASDSEGNLERFWFMPLVFHQTGGAGYRFYPPFYMRPSGADENSGYSYGLFHYHSWSPGKRVTWSWPYYHSENYADAGSEGEPEEKTISEYYTHFLPLYWSWKSSESRGRVIFPLIFNYKDKHTDIHVNLTGFARKTYTGPFSPDLSLGLGRKEGGWYLDTDLSWFYDVWSFSSRIPLKQADQTIPDGGDEPADSDMDMIKTAAAGSGLSGTENDMIKRKREFTRQDSEFFWGWKVLFGWMAYEHADSKRHFRLLPLSWFTWDENSNDRLYMFLPFYMSYKSDEEEYFVLAPFYASQREGDSYAKGILVNLYWDEYESENDYREQTVLWPFVNWYSSPRKSGYRVFPFLWHRSRLDENVRTTQTFSPLFYMRESADTVTGQTMYRRRINPFYHVKESKDEKSSSYSFFAPIIPLFWYSKEEFSSGENVSQETEVISPLWYYSRSGAVQEGEEHVSSTFWAPVIPLFYRSADGESRHWNLLGLLDSAEGPGYSRFFILPFYYGSSYGDVKHRNILGAVDWVSGSDGLRRSMVFPAYYWSREEGTSLVLFPLLTYIRKGVADRERFVAGMYWYSSPSYERQNFLYLLDHRRYMSSGYREDIWSGLFTMARYRVSPEIREMQLLWGALLDYKNYSSRDHFSVDALLWLTALEKRDDYLHHRILPLYSYWSDDDEWSLLLPPLLSYFSEDRAGDFDLGALGLVYYRNNNTASGHDRRMWLLGTLYNEVRRPERGYHEVGSLWGILWNYETEEETGFKKFTILKGLYKWMEKDGSEEHTVFWVF